MLKSRVCLFLLVTVSQGLLLMSKTLFVLIPGNGGCGSNTLAANWYGWLSTEMQSRSSWADISVSNYPDPYVAKESEWLPHVKAIIGDREKDAVLIGHSSGALAAMRLMEQMSLRGVILVSAAHTDLGDENERASGYFDRPWDWKAQVTNTGKIHQFHSEDDHLIPVSEARYVAKQLKAEDKEGSVEYEELQGHGHFFGPFSQLLVAIDSKFKPSGASEL